MIRRALAVLAVVVALHDSARAEILIGLAGPFSGQYQPFGQSLQSGAKAAVDALNAKGGVNGETLRLITADDQCDITQAEAAAQKLIAAHVDVVIGHFCSNPAYTAARAYDKAGLSLIAPTATLPTLTENGLSNVIRVSTRGDAQGAFAAKRILAKRPNARLALIDDGTAQMKAITAAFAAAYGKDPVLTATLPPDAKDDSELVAKLKAATIDTVYTATQAADAGRLFAQAQAAGLTLKHYGPDTLLVDTFWPAAGQAGESTLVSFPSDPQNTKSAKALAKDLKALGEAADGPALLTYAAVELYADAAAKGPRTGLAIAQTLKTGDAYQTVLGPFRFDAKGDGQDLRFSWFSWNNGQYQTIAPEVQ